VRLPARLRRQAGRHALVDGIPFELPIDSERARALMAAFPIDAERAAEALPGDELHPLRVWPRRGLLVITVIDYQATDIGRYVEFSIGIACTRGARPAPPLLPALLGRLYGTGQFVYDLPVSTEISVKGGKGIWGMPKHQAYLEFEVEPRRAASRYWLDERVAVEIEVRRPRFGGLPLASTGVNYSAFRGMLFRSWIHFRARAELNPPLSRAARLEIADDPRVARLKALGIGRRPLFAAFLPEVRGALDDHVEGWFLSYEEPPAVAPAGLESVVGLGLSRAWLPRPKRAESRPDLGSDKPGSHPLSPAARTASSGDQ
jgi:acetoacetate decarboxylase